MENFLDDRVIIPEDIKRMSREELDAEIERLEKKAALEKQKRLQSRVLVNKAV